MALVKLTAAATIAAGTLSVGTLAVADYSYAVETQTPTPVVITADPPVPPAPSDPKNLDQSGAEEAVRSAIRALRTNDANAFLRRLPAAEQQAAERGWKQIGSGDGNPWISGMVNRVLNASAGADGAQQVSTFITPFLAMIEPQSLAQQIQEMNGQPLDTSDRRRGGGLARMIVQSGISAVVSSLLATGFENEQINTLKGWFDSLATWLPTSGLNDPSKAQKAAEGLASALSKLGATSLTDLGKLELPQFLERVALAMPELKKVLAVYGLELDQALDSVQVASRELPPEAVPTGVNARLVTVTFNAFGGTHVLPLKLVERDGRWQVSADSPVIAWLRPRMDLDPRMFGGGQGGQRGGPGGQRGGPNGQRGQRGDAPAEPAEPAPKPEANPGF